jgi:hypothetical protein
MTDNKNCCGGHGHHTDKGDMSEWKEKFEKMSDSEKKEMLEMKKEHMTKKLAWVEEELAKLK